VKNLDVKADSLPRAEGLDACALLVGAQVGALESPKLVASLLELFPLPFDLCLLAIHPSGTLGLC
jgi:hypothetical protein